MAGWLTPRARSYRIEPTYGPTFLIGGVLTFLASLLAGMEGKPNHIFCLLAAANGIQNGIASIYSNNLIRCSLTGATADLAIASAQLLRGNTAKLTKSLVIASIVFNFWLGGIISFYFSRRLLSRTLFINAALFWLIGIALVVFLVRQIGVSVRAAVFGTWQWKKVLNKLMESERFQNLGSVTDPGNEKPSYLLDLFDEMDDNGDGVLEQEELFNALMQANIHVSMSMVKMLIQSADEDNDGHISRQEWEHLVQKMSTESSGTRSTIKHKV